jgi:hypothetical protein
VVVPPALTPPLLPPEPAGESLELQASREKVVRAKTPRKRRPGQGFIIEGLQHGAVL